MRLDQYLVFSSIIETRNKAQYEIKNGNVLVNNIPILKCSYEVLESDIIQVIKEKELKYVSKGGLKLERAINYFNVDINNKTCLDIGASTGGFTDCLIKNGAKKVYAIENGINQLHNSLKNNEKIISYENTNFLSFDLSTIDKIDIVTIDVSFIKIETIFDKLFRSIKNAKVLALIKPQFEVGQMYFKNGVIKDEKLRLEVLNRIKLYLDSKCVKYSEIIDSPILGGSGNKEYLICIDL